MKEKLKDVTEKMAETIEDQSEIKRSAQDWLSK